MTKRTRTRQPARQPAEQPPLRVLVAEDETHLTDLLSTAMRHEGWVVQTAPSGDAAVGAARDFAPDAVVLDVVLPDSNGVDVADRLREDNPELPVLFLTTADRAAEEVASLADGCGDYVAKPFSLEQVVARLRALMRRSPVVAEKSSPVLVVGDLVLDEDSHTVTRAGEEIALTATEFELLRFLMRNPRRVLSKSQILHRVWSYDFRGQANIVELYISYLRKKIDAGRRPMIHTRRGSGYVLQPA